MRVQSLLLLAGGDLALGCALDSLLARFELLAGLATGLGSNQDASLK